MIASDPAKSLNHISTDPTGSRHLARRNFSEDDLVLANLDMPCTAIREEDHTHRYLIGKAEEIGSKSSGGLQSHGIALCECPGNGIRPRRENAQHQVIAWHVVQTTRNLPDDTQAAVAGQSLIHSITTTKVQEVGWSEDQSGLVGHHPVNHLSINRMCMLSHNLLSE